MPRPGPIAHAVLSACAWICVLVLGLRCQAQDDQKAVYTLKVYTDLVQVPTLVLDHDRQPMGPLDFSRFQVSLDSGKKFAPTHVRIEGQDPLSVAILIDMSGEHQLIENFADAAATMAKNSLHPTDLISVYALKCDLVRSVRQVPAEPDAVKKAVEDALKAPVTNPKGRCSKNVYLWGAIVQVVKDLSVSRGRRVILAVTEGQDWGSAIKWPDVHSYAASEGVAIFGINDGFDFGLQTWGERTNAFHSLCEWTGGIVMHATDHDLHKRLDQWVTMLRNRYVIEFPMPQRLGLGGHNIDIFVKRDDMAFVTLAGVSMSLPDPQLTSDPNYIPSQAGADIPVGTRRPLRK